MRKFSHVLAPCVHYILTRFDHTVNGGYVTKLQRNTATLKLHTYS